MVPDISTPERWNIFASHLARTRRSAFGRLINFFGIGEISSETFEELESILVQADLGVRSATQVVEKLRRDFYHVGLTKSVDLEVRLREELGALLIEPHPLELKGDPTVILVVGVNGSGKTTTSAKLAKTLRDVGGAKPLLAACDTFRAAANEQLHLWGQDIGVKVIAGQRGSDPGAVLFDAVSAADARGADLVIADTAGRMHNKTNLMEELKKICRVASKASHGAPHHILLVLDAVNGQNSVIQARAFREAVRVTGVIVTKLDSSSRGGVIFATGNELGLPVQYVGFGEEISDLHPFDPNAFVEGILE